MENKNNSSTKVYFMAMCMYWLIFGLITIFYPQMMDMFHSADGITSNTRFSNHVWMHGGFDILALCIILFVLSGEQVSRRILIAAALAALMPTTAITYSLLATPFWNPLFVVADLGCFAFVIWGFALASKQIQVNPAGR